MKKLENDELYRHIDTFLKEKGIEIRDTAPLGNRLQAVCRLLTDTINNTQSALEKARNQMDIGIDKVRVLIHKKTAPRKAAPKQTQKRKKKAAAKKTASAQPKTRSKNSTKKTSKKAAKKTDRKQ